MVNLVKYGKFPLFLFCEGAFFDLLNRDTDYTSLLTKNFKTMKNLTKIFMAVAVAMFAFSCVNDTTEDIAVKVGGKTTLAISLGGG